MLLITAIGEILIDMTQQSVNKDGSVVFSAHPGGAPANVAVAASKLGSISSFIGCVGNDYFGMKLKEVLIANNVKTNGLQTTESASTTIALVTIDKTGERTFSFMRKPGADTCINVQKALEAVQDARILHFGSFSLSENLSAEAVLSTVKAAKKNGAIISYDPNFRADIWKDIGLAKKKMREVLSFCNIVKLSEEETELLSGEKDFESSAKKLIENGVELVLVTLGAKGAFFKTACFEGRVPGFSVKVADTNGAGDTFLGAFLSRLSIRGDMNNLKKEEVEQWVRFANKAASITTSRPGAISAMPTLEEVVKTL